MHINVKKIVLTVGLWMATGMYDGVPKNYSENKNIDSKNKQLTEQQDSNKQISVKLGTGFVYDVTRTKAEKGLDSLCRNTNVLLEDSWMYYHNKLTDIGLHEQPLSVIPNETLLALTIYDSKKGDTLRLYHIHPSSYAKDSFSPPSVDDVITHAVIKSGCNAKKIHLIEGIFDGRGKWELDIDKERMQKINKDEQSQMEQRIYIGVAINRSYTIYKVDNITRMFANSDVYDSSAINDYIYNMRKIGIILKFTPSEVLQKQH